MSRSFQGFPVALSLAVLTACVAVVAMSGVVHLVDGTEIFPHDRHGWREFIEYAASISFSFATGMVLGRMEWLRRQKAQLESYLIRAVASLLVGAKTGAKRLDSSMALIDIISKVAAVSGTTVGALTGLHAFF